MLLQYAHGLVGLGARPLLAVCDEPVVCWDHTPYRRLVMVPRSTAFGVLLSVDSFDSRRKVPDKATKVIVCRWGDQDHMPKKQEHHP